MTVIVYIYTHVRFCRPANQLKVVIAITVSEFAAVTMKQTFVTAVQTGSLGSITVVASSAAFVEERK